MAAYTACTAFTAFTADTAYTAHTVAYMPIFESCGEVLFLLA